MTTDEAMRARDIRLFSVNGIARGPRSPVLCVSVSVSVCVLCVYMCV